MANKFYYLLTLLPALPEVGEAFETGGVFALIRQEQVVGVEILADLLEAEILLEHCAEHHFVAEKEDFAPVFPEVITEAIVDLAGDPGSLDESQWHDKVYTLWFKLMAEVGHKTGSNLLADWAVREYSLRAQIQLQREHQGSDSSASGEQMLPDFIKKNGFIFDQSELINAYKAFDDPMAAEKFLDQARVDYLRKAAAQYSFDMDELVAYMLELRIHRRYERMSPDKGRKILEEVTTL